MLRAYRSPRQLGARNLPSTISAYDTSASSLGSSHATFRSDRRSENGDIREAKSLACCRA